MLKTGEGKITVTVHANDVYTVNEDESAISISDQYRALLGDRAAQDATKELKWFLTELECKWNVNVILSRDLPSSFADIEQKLQGAPDDDADADAIDFEDKLKDYDNLEPHKGRTIE